MSFFFSINWVLFGAIWYLGNGLLHDTFVIINHKGPYDRELLRLLMDGHVLIFSGILLLVCYFMLQNKIQSGAIIAFIVAISMLVYCIMIFPFLKSFATIAISLIVMAVCIHAYTTFPNINQIMQTYK